MKIKLLCEGAKAPARADKGSAGYDCYAPYDFIVRPGRSVLPLGFAIELDPGTEAQMRPRSGFSAKGMEGLPLDKDLGAVPARFDADVVLGTIDESYRGEVGAILLSREARPFIIQQGTRVAQMVVSRYETPKLELAAELSETERRGGFGHTGSK